jgi:hypothetical protein
MTGSGFSQRLGKLLYGVCCFVACGFATGAIVMLAIAVFGDVPQQLDAKLYSVISTILACIAWLVARASRNLLAGR